MADLQAGTIWGSFRVESVLGRGPNAVIYRAVRSADSRPVALKIFSEDLDPAILSRFEDDTRRVVGLGNPNVLKVESVGREGGRLFIVTERFEGRSLRTYTPRSLRDGVDFLLKAARGLSAGWMRLILHRNLKPENILMASSGELKLADFGLYRDPTPHWSPERIKGQTPDLRGELYTLGAIFKEVVPAGDADIDALLHHMTRVETFERVQMVEDVISRLETWLSRAPAPPPVPMTAPEPDPIPMPPPVFSAPPPISIPTPMPAEVEFPNPALDSAREELVRTLAAIPAKISRTLTVPKLPPAPVYVPPPPPIYKPPPPPVYVPPPPTVVRPPPPPPPKLRPVEVYVPPPAPPPPTPIRPAARRSSAGGLLKTIVVFGCILGLVVYQYRGRQKKLEEIERLSELQQEDRSKARRMIEERIRNEQASQAEKDLLTKLQTKDWEEARAKIRALDGEAKYSEALEECDRFLKKAGPKPPQEALDLRKTLKDWVSILSRAESNRRTGSDRLAYDYINRADATRSKEVQAILLRWCDEDWKKTKTALDTATTENDPDSALVEIDRFLKKPHQGGSHKKDAETRRNAFQADVDYSDLKSRVENLQSRNPADAIAVLEAFLAKPHEGGTHRGEVQSQIAKLQGEAKSLLYSGRSTISRMAISPDGKRVAFTADGLRIVDLATREEVWNTPVKSLQKAVWLGSDDRLVTATSVKVTLWNVAKKTEVRSVAPTIGYFSALAASADAKTVVASQSDGSLWTWNTASEEPPRVEKDAAAGTMTLALSPDGTLLAIALRGDRTIRVRTLASGMEQKWAGPASTVVAMALSPDGKLLLTGSSNGLVSIWNAENGDAGRDLAGHTSGVTWASFSADGKSVVSGGLDSLLRVTEVKAGAATLELKGHRGRISAVYFLPDGGLVSSGADGSVRLWPKP